MGTENSKGYIHVESERVAKLESEVDRVQRDVGDIKVDISAIKQDGTETKIALTEISMTLKAINDVKPRVEALERFKYRAMGMVAVIMFLLSMFGPNIRAFVFG